MQDIEGDEIMNNRIGTRLVTGARRVPHRNLSHLAVFIVVGATVLAACGSNASSANSSKATTNSSTSKTAATATPYVIHAILSETGSATFLGSREKKSIEALASDVNSKGGIDGHPVKLDILDNQSNPSVGVSLVSGWVASHVPFILNGSVVATNKAVDALAGPSGPLMFDLSPGVTPKAGSFVFSSGVAAGTNIQADLNFLQSKGFTKIASITSSDASGADGLNQLHAALGLPQFSSMDLLTSQTFDPTSVSVTTQLSVIKAAKPQALIIWTTGTPLGTVLKGMSELGMGNIPTITTDGNAVNPELTSFSSILPKSFYIGTGAYAQQPKSLPSPLNSVIANFDAVVSQAGGHPNEAWALSGAAFLIMVSAVKALGVQATAVQLREYLQSKMKNYTGIFGTYDFSVADHRGLGLNDSFVVQWNGSSFVPVSGPGGKGSPS